MEHIFTVRGRPPQASMSQRKIQKIQAIKWYDASDLKYSQQKQTKWLPVIRWGSFEAVIYSIVTI